jgi:hypothetical protein
MPAEGEAKGSDPGKALEVSARVQRNVPSVCPLLEFPLTAEKRSSVRISTHCRPRPRQSLQSEVMHCGLTRRSKLTVHCPCPLGTHSLAHGQMTCTVTSTKTKRVTLG